MQKLAATGILAAAFLVGGCSGQGTIGPTNTDSLNGNPGGATPITQPGSSTALFHPAAGILPYPTDLYFAGSTDGTLNIQPANALMPNQAAVNDLDGFSTTAVIRERFGGALNPASFTASSIVVVPVATDNLTKATSGVLGAPLILGTDFSAALATDAAVGPTILEITPLHPLQPSTCIDSTTHQFLGTNCKSGTGYLVFLTNGITDASGHPAVPDADYATIKAALPSCAAIMDPTLHGICLLTGAHMQIAQVLQLNPANIVLSFSFTTESTVDTLELMSATASTTGQTIKTNPTGLNTSQLPGLGLAGHADIYVGALSIPYYLGTPAQGPMAPLTAFWQAPPFPLDPTSTNVTRFNPLPVPTQAHLLIPLLVTVPNANSAYAKAGGQLPPSGGWPVLIFQHGITRSREDMFTVADSFADAGFMVAAIDLPLHGVTNQQDPLYANSANPAYTGIIPAGSGSIERTFDLDLNTNAGNTVIPGSPPDGVIDPSGSHAINLTSPLTTRDSLREGVIDLVMFSRLLPGLSLGAAGAVNAGAIHYLGHSLGAIEGTTFMAVVGPGINTATLANPGGVVTQILITSPSFAPVINAGLAAQGVIPGTTLYANFWRDIQTTWDSGDPVNYIALATAAHPIHLLQVVGGTPPALGCTPLAPPPANCPDQVVPNATTQQLITASAYGPQPLVRIKAGQAPVVMNSGGIRGYVNFIEGDHGSIIDDKVPAVTAEMQTEAISFTGVAVPPAGIPANTPGTTLLLADPTVIQP
jgi:pimeloyl-ACP methyl ester carboxylesterase